MAGKILVTGFEPFGGESVNPSWQSVKTLRGRLICDHEIAAMELPVVFRKAAREIEKAIDEIGPAVVLSVGESGGASAIRVERFALNLDDARMPDNGGNLPADEAIAADGPIGYMATIPTKQAAEAIKTAGIPAILSYSAGTYLCNHVFYAASHYVSKKHLDTKVGFLHVPYLPEQAVAKRNAPSMSADVIARAVEIALRVSLRN